MDYCCLHFYLYCKCISLNFCWIISLINASDADWWLKWGLVSFLLILNYLVSNCSINASKQVLTPQRICRSKRSEWGYYHCRIWFSLEITLKFKKQWLGTVTQLFQCWGISPAFETNSLRKCVHPSMANVTCRWLLKDWFGFIFIFTFYCIFCSVIRSTVSIWSQFSSCKRKLSNVVGFDLYHAAVQHSSVNNKGKPDQSHRLTCPAATLLFFLQLVL